MSDETDERWSDSTIEDQLRTELLLAEGRIAQLENEVSQLRRGLIKPDKQQPKVTGPEIEQAIACGVELEALRCRIRSQEKLIAALQAADPQPQQPRTPHEQKVASRAVNERDKKIKELNAHIGHLNDIIAGKNKERREKAKANAGISGEMKMLRGWYPEIYSPQENPEP